MSYGKIHNSFVRSQIWGFNPSQSVRFSGHVPYGFQRFGESSKKLTNSALCDFSSNYRRRQSTEWAPVNVVK
ncbi:jg23720 [Pararge aegeria aegeria]|uniref:Jg23720 protein n=1 Tax=Pararge aegeria aegeria TaxID=348720 RepID=A0A8S4R3C0_9NEOP|nr:jg23720 [Pararge aegeria aegeria]